MNIIIYASSIVLQMCLLTAIVYLIVEFVLEIED